MWWAWLLTLSAVASISVFEGIWSLLVMWGTIQWWRQKGWQNLNAETKMLWIWSGIYILVTIISSWHSRQWLSAGEFWGKLWERGFYPLILPLTVGLAPRWLRLNSFEKLRWAHLGLSVILTITWWIKWIWGLDWGKLGWWGIFEISQWMGIWALVWMWEMFQGSGFGKLRWVKWIGWLMAIACTLILIILGRRSGILAFAGTLLFWSIGRFRLKPKTLAMILSFKLAFFWSVFWWNRQDPRFQALLSLIQDSRNWTDAQVWNDVTTIRFRIAIHALQVLQHWWQHGEWIRLIVGGGLWVGIHNPIGPADSGMFFESIVFLSETLERGLIGLALILAAYAYIWMRVWKTAGLRNKHDWLKIWLMHHSLMALTTTWWDAMLPYFLFLWGLSINQESSLNSLKDSGIQPKS